MKNKRCERCNISIKPKDNLCEICTEEFADMIEDLKKWMNNMETKEFRII